MSQGLSAELVAEEQAIQRVGRMWAYSRDAGEWETLEACFHPEARVDLSWYSGSASEFIECSRLMAGKRRPEERHKHLLGNMRTVIRGRRAVHETDVQILIREFIDGILFDYTGYARFYDLYEKRDREWRIASKSCIYERDRLDPVIPGSVGKSFYDAVPMSGHASGFAYMRFRLQKKGAAMPGRIVLGGSEDERQLRAEGERWLATGL